MKLTITPEMATILEAVETSNKPIYITGKAGTGKTTLLKYIISSINKKFVVTAPTGVAAINAGGTTLHSLLRIPFGCLNDKTPLGGLSKDKAELIRELDAIIIDEVSMVRPDLIDFIDRKLRHVRKCSKPFGGLQIIMFGDLYQLPPVVRPDERKIMSEFYKGDYFFFANVFKECGFQIFELTHIFRQSDSKFIRILNNIRLYNVDPEDMDVLAERRMKGCAEDFKGNAIHICTHKADVQRINNNLLGKTKRKYEAKLDGKFSESSIPCDTALALREGARVMMLVNNHEDGYSNGSLGHVVGFNKGKNLNGDIILVELDNGKTIEVCPHTWKAYDYELSNGVIVQKEIGSCSQYPLSLAWAITIHKSQGLTFDSAIIHNKKAFCPGQVYVALSRCRTLEGVTLEGFITPRQVMADKALLAFEEAMMKSNGVFTTETYKLITE